MTDLSPSQFRVLRTIARLFERNGIPPTLAEVGYELDLGAPGVLFHVRPLREMGLLRQYDPQMARCLVPTIAGYEALKARRAA